MIVKIEEIIGKFDAVLQGHCSREDASEWARLIREADDKGALVYSPTSAEQSIWNAVLFLEGIDMLDAPGSFLHNREDIERERSLLANAL